jgi:hypothetical protein
VGAFAPSSLAPTVWGAAADYRDYQGELRLGGVMAALAERQSGGGRGLDGSMAAQMRVAASWGGFGMGLFAENRP